MSYSKNHDPWISSDLLTTNVLDNFETIYNESSSYLTSHVHDDLYSTKTEMQNTYWYSGNDGSGSGSDADLIYHADGNLHSSDFAGLGVDTGLIILWYGSVASIPAGWHLCEGTEGTVNLTDRFVIGAGDTYAAGATGGSTTFTAAGSITVSNHTITQAEMGPHGHPFGDYTASLGSYPYSCAQCPPCNYIAAASSTSSTGTTPSSSGGGSGHGHSTAEGTHFDGTAIDCLPYSMALCYIQKI